MSKLKEKLLKRKVRHYRLRKKVFGIAQKPRLSVRRTLNHIYAQLIDDAESKTLLAVSTIKSDIKKTFKSGSNINAAKTVGKLLAQEAIKKGIKSVVFDKSGLSYHGRIKALADEARKNGLKF